MKRPSEKMHDRAALLRGAAISLMKNTHNGKQTLAEIFEIQNQAKACRREAGILIRRARHLAKLEAR